jgi:aconitate hydratase
MKPKAGHPPLATERRIHRSNLVGMGLLPLQFEPGESATEFRATVRIDTPKEIEYYRHGGILEYVLRQLAGIA